MTGLQSRGQSYRLMSYVELINGGCMRAVGDTALLKQYVPVADTAQMS